MPSVFNKSVRHYKNTRSDSCCLFLWWSLLLPSHSAFHGVEDISTSLPSLLKNENSLLLYAVLVLTIG